MNTKPKNKKPMTREEVLHFVELIKNRPILTSRETNAASNKLKDEAWTSLVAAFNAKFGSYPRQKEQLKLKWDNLKKAARKRTQQIRMNRLKAGDGKADVIPADEILDKVANLIGSTCTGFEVPFGGDRYGGGDVLFELEMGTNSKRIHNNAAVQMPTEDLLLHTKEAKKRKSNILTTEKREGNKNKAKKIKAEDGRRERNLAIAEYLRKKIEKLELEIKLLKLANKEKLYHI